MTHSWGSKFVAKVFALIIYAENHENKAIHSINIKLLEICINIIYSAEQNLCSK